MTERKLGRLPSGHDDRDLVATSYMAAVPEPPTSIDYGIAVSSWPGFANSRVGDCAIAAQAHQIETWTANALGKTSKVTTAAVLKRYSLISGYDPDDPSTDVGCNERDVLKTWLKDPLSGHSLTAFAQAPLPRDSSGAQKAFTQALWLFGGLYLGFDLPITAQAQVEAGRPWDVVSDDVDGEPGSWGGHAINAVAADSGGVTVITWGKRQLCTWRFLATYCSESWSMISGDWLKSDKSPNGFDLKQLEADMAALK